MGLYSISPFISTAFLTDQQSRRSQDAWQPCAAPGRSGCRMLNAVRHIAPPENTAWAAQGQGGTSGAPKDTAVALKLHSVLWIPDAPPVISFFCPCQRTAWHAPNPHNNLSWHRHRPSPPVPSAASPWPVPPFLGG